MDEKKTFKQFVAKTEIDDSDRTIVAVISTASIDRDQEIVLSKGANFENYEKNPVVQWAHSYKDIPIGAAMWVKKGTQNGLPVIRAKWKPTPRPKDYQGDWLPDTIYELYKEGYLSAFSIGFIPRKSRRPTDEDIKKNPEWAKVFRIIEEWDLLEFSAVPVPANPEALATAVKSNKLDLSKEVKDDLGVEHDEKIDEDNISDNIDEKEVETVKLIETDAQIVTDPKISTESQQYEQDKIDDTFKKIRGEIY